MVSEKDRAHFRTIAEGERLNNEEDLRADALRDPTENIERGLRLSGAAMELARQFGAVREEKHKPSLVALWKQRHRATQ